MPTPPSKDGQGTCLLIIILVIAALILSVYGMRQDREKHARWRKANPPAYARGDVLESKLGVKLLVDEVIVRGPRKYWYDCWYYKKTEKGQKRTWRYFEPHEIQGLWRTD